MQLDAQARGGGAPPAAAAVRGRRVRVRKGASEGLARCLPLASPLSFLASPLRLRPGACVRYITSQGVCVCLCVEQRKGRTREGAGAAPAPPYVSPPGRPDGDRPAPRSGRRGPAAAGGERLGAGSRGGGTRRRRHSSPRAAPRRQRRRGRDPGGAGAAARRLQPAAPRLRRLGPALPRGAGRRVPADPGAAHLGAGPLHRLQQVLGLLPPGPARLLVPGGGRAGQLERVPGAEPRQPQRQRQRLPPAGAAHPRGGQRQRVRLPRVALPHQSRPRPKRREQGEKGAFPGTPRPVQPSRIPPRPSPGPARLPLFPRQGEQLDVRICPCLGRSDAPRVTFPPGVSPAPP